MSILLLNVSSRLYDTQDSFRKRITFKLTYIEVRGSMHCLKREEKNIWQTKNLIGTYFIIKLYQADIAM